MSSEIATQSQQPMVESNLLQVLERAASNPDVDVEKMERLMAMHERLLAKHAEAALNAALARVQANIKRIAADANNPQTKSKYASYPALDKVLRPLYTQEGLSLSFDTGDAPATDWVRVLCYVSHSDGHTRTYRVDLPADGKGAKGGDVMTKTHAAGSAMSYGMRYLLKLIFNVAVGEDDDDGNAASIPRITEKQADDLRALIEEVGADEGAFLRYFRAQSIETFAAQAYDEAVRQLQRKRKA